MAHNDSILCETEEKVKSKPAWIKNNNAHTPSYHHTKKKKKKRF